MLEIAQLLLPQVEVEVQVEVILRAKTEDLIVEILLHT